MGVGKRVFQAKAKHPLRAMFVGKPGVDCGPCGNQMFPTFAGRLACRVYMGGLWPVKLERSRMVVGMWRLRGLRPHPEGNGKPQQILSRVTTVRLTCWKVESQRKGR